MNTTPTQQAIQQAGGTVALARALGTPHYNVSKWAKAQIPPRYVLDVERLSGVSRHQLRPDVFGPAQHPAEAA
jgi:DNA-binding transcriptional regulator YdaS (Cro superfamily)